MNVDQTTNPHMKKKKFKRRNSNASDASMGSQHSNDASSQKMSVNSDEPKNETQGADPFNVDDIIKELIKVQHRNPGTMVNLELSQIQWLINKTLDLIIQQPMLLQLNAPLLVGSDIHG